MSQTFAGLEFESDGQLWSSDIELPCWKEFVGHGKQSRTATIRIHLIERDGHHDEHLILSATTRLLPAQHRAVASLSSNAEAIQTGILCHLLDHYPGLRKDHLPFVNDIGWIMPEVRTIEDFKPLIKLTDIYVLPIEHSGLPCLGLLFNCSWDQEHGLGFVVNGTRVVEMGGADTAFQTWSVERAALAQVIDDLQLSEHWKQSVFLQPIADFLWSQYKIFVATGTGAAQYRLAVHREVMRNHSQWIKHKFDQYLELCASELITNGSVTPLSDLLDWPELTEIQVETMRVLSRHVAWPPSLTSRLAAWKPGTFSIHRT